MEPERNREPQKPKNQFESQFPSLAKPPPVKPAANTDALRSNLVWGSRAPGSEGKPGQALGGKAAAPAKPKLKMVKQSISKVSRSRPVVAMALVAKPQAQQPAKPVSGLKAPIRGAGFSNSPTPLGKSPPSETLLGVAVPITTQAASQLATGGSVADAPFQPSAAQRSLARKIMNHRAGGGRSITDVSFLNMKSPPQDGGLTGRDPSGLVGDYQGPPPGLGLGGAGGFTGGLTGGLMNSLLSGASDDIMGDTGDADWETEQRLLQQMGWTDGMSFDDDDEADDGGLTEEEIKAFKEMQVSRTGGPAPVPEPVPAAVIATPAWMTQSAAPIPAPVDGDVSSDESSDDELS